MRGGRVRVMGRLFFRRHHLHVAQPLGLRPEEGSSPLPPPLERAPIGSPDSGRGATKGAKQNTQYTGRRRRYLPLSSPFIQNAAETSAPGQVPNWDGPGVSDQPVHEKYNPRKPRNSINRDEMDLGRASAPYVARPPAATRRRARPRITAAPPAALSEASLTRPERPAAQHERAPRSRGVVGLAFRSGAVTDLPLTSAHSVSQHHPHPDRATLHLRNRWCKAQSGERMESRMFENVKVFCSELTDFLETHHFKPVSVMKFYETRMVIKGGNLIIQPVVDFTKEHFNAASTLHSTVGRCGYSSMRIAPSS